MDVATIAHAAGRHGAATAAPPETAALLPPPRGQPTALQLWAFRAGVGSDVAALQAVLAEAQPLLQAARSTETKNESLEPHLKELHHRLGHAEKLLDELNYYRIHDEIHAAGPPRYGGCSDGEDQLVSGLSGQVTNWLVTGYGEEPNISTSEVDMVQACNSTARPSAPPSTGLQLVVYNADPKKASLLTSIQNNTAPWVELNNGGISQKIAKLVEELSDMKRDVLKALKLEEKLDSIGLDLNGMVCNHRETASYGTEANIYGRQKELDQIIHKLTSCEFANGSTSVLAITGNGGVGKTTLARLVFKDPRITKYFTLMMWIYVSVNFDEVKLTRELLEYLYGDRYESVKDFYVLQEILENRIKSKRLLLVMDDIWEDQDKCRWDTFLAPFLRSQVTGNVILATSRKLSVAKMISTTDNIKLDGLNKDDFWPLFKECAFGNVRHPGDSKLENIGRRIAKQLKGYPLEAKSVGALLRRRPDAKYWRRILESNEWKYQQGTDDIMTALKISYKYLPFHLQRCFSYCALFPKGYRFFEDQLVYMWIAQGFVHPTDKSKRKEDVGSEYLNNLTDWGFFLKEPPRPSLLMHDLIHDLAMLVSSDECFILDDLTSRPIPRLVQHVSVITESAYRVKLDGSIVPNERFKQKFVNASGTLQARNLNTVLLIGGYDLSFAEIFRTNFDEVKAVRVLRLEMVFFDMNSLLNGLSSFVHLRYLELTFLYTSSLLHFPEDICKLYHLEVLLIKNNWGINTDLPKHFSNLVNLQHFVAHEALHSKIVGVGKLVRLQELKAFVVRREREFSIAQLRGLNELQKSLRIYNLENVESAEEAADARLQDKMHLSGLHLSWDVMDTESMFLEELRPHQNLKHLRIDRYRGTTPTWLTSKFLLTSLQSLHLENCRKWRSLPPLEQVPLLRELHLLLMPFVKHVQIGSHLEVLELRQMPGLQECVMIDKDHTCTNLRILEVVECRNLKELPFLHRFLHLRGLQIRDCPPRFDALLPLPLNDMLTDIDISNVDSFPFQNFSLCPAAQPDPDLLHLEIQGNDRMEILDEKVLALHNLIAVKELEIRNGPVLTHLPWAVFQQLTSLKRLTIFRCPKLFSSFALPDVQDKAISILPSSLEELELSACNISGKQLSRLLSNLSLSTLKIADCDQITSLAVELPTNHEGFSVDEGSWCNPPKLLLTLEKLHISFKNVLRGISSDMVFLSKKGLGQFVLLKELVVKYCPELLSSIVSGLASQVSKCSLLPASLTKLQITHLPDRLLSCSNLIALVDLHLELSPNLTSLELNSCPSLQSLMIIQCAALASCEGLQYLKSLKVLKVQECPKLISLVLDSCTSLLQLSVTDCKSLSSLEGSQSFTSLTDLIICKNPSLLSLNLLACTALEKLEIEECRAFSSWKGLPALTHLKVLTSFGCPGFIPSWNAQADEIERKGIELSLPLKKLDIDDANFLSVPICRMLDSLERLSIHGIGKCSLIFPADKVECLTNEQEKALQLLTSLKELAFLYLRDLHSLPAELHRLPLEKLEISGSLRLISLPVDGLPTSLKELLVLHCSVEFHNLCRDLMGIQNVYLDRFPSPYTDGDTPH